MRHPIEAWGKINWLIGIIGASRSASISNRTNDRLAERLARAVAAKNSAPKPERPDSLALSSGIPSRTGSPITVSESPRQSLEVASNEAGDKKVEEDITAHAKPPIAEVADKQDALRPETPDIAVQPATPGTQPSMEVQETPNWLSAKPDIDTPSRLSQESTRSSLPRESIDSARQHSSRPSLELHASELADTGISTKSPEEYEALLKQIKSDYETSELQRQEEVHGYIERIDALQSKLQYLAKESAEAARKAAGTAASGSPEKKLADKEEQVALLMQEGQQLSKKELSHLTTIKKLRAKIQEDSKEVSEAKAKQEKAERDNAIMVERWRRAEASEKRISERLKGYTLLQKEHEALKADSVAKDSMIADLKSKLEEEIAQEKQAEAKLASDALEAERRRVADLEEELANLKIEKTLVSDRAQVQIKELREKMDKDSERARMSELEMKKEQQMLESRLEVMRARAEEVASGAAGDAQAKLLRQIETLQTQYAVASENWQGIEASLIARATSLEKERDEATKREADIRRKAREVVRLFIYCIVTFTYQSQTLKAKRNEDELEESRSQLPRLRRELADHKLKLDDLQKQADEAESALIDARTAFEQERQAWKSELHSRLEQERQKYSSEGPSGPGSLGYNRAESPVTSTRRGLTSEYLGLQNLQIRRASARSINNEPPTPSLLNRRPSAQPLNRSSGGGTPTRQDSMPSLKTDGDNADSKSIYTDHDDFFENNISPASPHQTLNDMVSVSTAGAGPSVQLVERMSSAVRRLESEKVATKEDIARLAAQRDEARAEIVSLMREVEVKRAADAKVAELETEIKEINSRYQTTLEMLGEKSEMVEELKSDIDDIKAMYRELVERTVK